MRFWPWWPAQAPTITTNGTRFQLGPDGIPIRDGLTYEQDSKRVLDMLCLCGELDGLGPRESYSSYLRRMIDELIRLKRAAGEY